MKVKDEKGRVLISKNAVICGMWKKAGYKEIKEKKSGDGAGTQSYGSGGEG